MVKIAFLENKLTIRGSSSAMYDYAHYNETILGNQSVIITRRPQDNNITTKMTYNKFAKRFPMIYYSFAKEINDIVIKEKIDILYVIKSGDSRDLLYTNKCKCVIHCVFDVSDFHGDVYATISNCVNRIHNKNYPVVPHIIKVHDTEDNLRDKLDIPTNAKVFGYYGGNDSFNIQFVTELIKEWHKQDTYFIFMNIDRFCSNPNVIFLNGTNDEKYKKMFINTCNAMLHARERGETYGIVCAEFSVSGKPVITYGKSIENNHIELLGDKAIMYNNKHDLTNILINWEDKGKHIITGYHESTSPEYVMDIFKKVFIA